MKDTLLDDQYHDYFNSDPDFRNDYFSNGGGVVQDNVSAASNSTTGNYESHFYRDINYVSFLFCLNPGEEIEGSLPSSLNDQASSLRLRPRTSVQCI